MPDCPNCGAQNRDTAAACRICLYSFLPADTAPPASQATTQPPRPAPTTSAPTVTPGKKRRYFQGLGAGLIPILLIFLVINAAGSSDFSNHGEFALGLLAPNALTALICFPSLLIVTIFHLANRRNRVFGYGLLTALLLFLLTTYLILSLR